MTLLTTHPVSFPLPKPKWLPGFMRIDIWAVNILEPHLMSVSVRVNTFVAEDRCWSCLHWKCRALSFSLLPLQHLCHLSAASQCCLFPVGRRENLGKNQAEVDRKHRSWQSSVKVALLLGSHAPMYNFCGKVFSFLEPRESTSSCCAGQVASALLKRRLQVSGCL